MRKFLFAVFITTLLLSVTTLSYASSSVHNVISNKPMFLTDGQTGTSYTSLTGNGIISWQDGTRNGFFDFTVTVKDTGSTYQVIMDSISNSAADSIEGLWDIK